MDDSGERRTANLRGELARWRTRRKLSFRALAVRMECDHSHLWKIENGKATFTREMAESCDNALGAGGALIAAWVNARTSIRPAQLPAAHGQVVGRDAELAALDDAVSDPHSGNPSVIAIDGPAGAGKTALALRWAHRVAVQFVDGQLYADLRGFAPTDERVSAGEVLEAFLTALGATSIPPTVRERAALFRSLLTDRKVLIVLDNVAGVSDVECLLPGSAGCAVVVTSRRILSGLVSHLVGTRVTVGFLAEPDAVSLVTRLVGDARARAAPAAVLRLTRRCGHLPLALRVVAEHVALYPHRSIDTLLDELTDDDGRLAVAETAELRSALFWSYRCLASDGARLFRLIGIHPRPRLSVAAVAALADLTTPQARRLLHQLASLHLITIESDQVVRLDDLTHAYVRHLVVTEDDHGQRSDAVRRLASWYLTAVHEASRHLLPGDISAPFATPERVDGNGAVDEAGAAGDVEATSFADDRTARAWCDAELVHYGALVRLTLTHDLDLATHLGAELGRVGLLHAETARPPQPANPRSTTRAETRRATQRAPLDVPPAASGRATTPPDRPPDARHVDLAVSTPLAHRHRDVVSGLSSPPARDDPREDGQRACDSRVEAWRIVGDHDEDDHNDDHLVELVREATARLIVA